MVVPRAGGRKRKSFANGYRVFVEDAEKAVGIVGGDYYPTL